MAKALRKRRVVKAPEERRRELLDCAQALFFSRGYERTSVNDVIARARLSKGAFYHYFRSKEELLEALAARLAQQSVEQLRGVLDDPALDALARMNAFLARSRQMKAETAPMLRKAFDAVFRPENVVLYERLNAAVVAVMTPVLARIIAEGVAEGRFKTPDPEATAALLLALGRASRDAVAHAIGAKSKAEKAQAADALERHLRLQAIAIDRILGLPDGSIRFVHPGFVRAIMDAR